MVTGNRLSARFRNAAIKKKLIVLMLVITSVSLLLSGASFITLDYLHARERFVDKMRTLSDVMATNVAAPLVQGDPDAAKDTLMSMKVAELVMNVFIHSADGKLLVQYHRSPKEHFHIENSPARSIDHSPAHSIDHSLRTPSTIPLSTPVAHPPGSGASGPWTCSPPSYSTDDVSVWCTSSPT